ncbi:MAG: L,D-transpeptidase [Gemmatimonadota bacterium]
MSRARLTAAVALGGLVLAMSVGRRWEPPASAGADPADRLGTRSLSSAVAGPAAVGCALADASTAPDGPTRADMELRLNVPAFRLDVLQEGVVDASFPVAVGAPRYPTPAGEYEVTEITWNPGWHPPDSEWALGRDPEPPGPENPMGRVKLRFDSLLFIHGTPDTVSIGSPSSHGCVRLSNDDVLRLADLVLASTATAAPVEATASDDTVPQTVSLERPVRLSVVYRIAEVRDGRLELHPDVYGLASSPVQEVLRLLEDAGLDITERVSRSVREALPGPDEASTAIPIDSLRTGSP